MALASTTATSCPAYMLQAEAALARAEARRHAGEVTVEGGFFFDLTNGHMLANVPAKSVSAARASAIESGDYIELRAEDAEELERQVAAGLRN